MRTLQSLRLTLISPSARIYPKGRNVILSRTQNRYCSSHQLRTEAAHASAQSPKDDIKHSSPTISGTVDKIQPPVNDHHVWGRQLNLFSTTPYSAGTPLLHTDGSHIFLKLQSLLRAQHQAFGFREVISPTIYKQSLWERSGHWQNYSDDMFEVISRGSRGEGEDASQSKDEKWGLKPMNCPGHCLLFATESRSYRELPVRFADFSPLHRDEVSGSLSGLTRARRFHQDDGHIFCRPDQVKAEIASTLQMVNLVYSVFDLKPHKLLLSTRPEKSFIGTEEEWTRAESQLQSALEESGLDWALNPGDGAFYGPKIDIILQDNQKKQHQTATIQLDFQLPQRFDLEYQSDSPSNRVNEDDTQSTLSKPTEVPILIHRAILGSIERFMALLIDHYQGKWPFWMNPRQVSILTLNDTDRVLAHASRISSILSGTHPTANQNSRVPLLQPLHQHQHAIDIDSSSETVSRKIVHARTKGVSIVCLVGEEEARSGSVAATFLCAAGASEKAARMKGIVKEAVSRSAVGEEGSKADVPESTKKRASNDKSLKVTCSPEQLRTIMRRFCDEWL